MRDLYLRTVQWAVTGSLYDEFGHCRAQAATATEPATACGLASLTRRTLPKLACDAEFNVDSDDFDALNFIPPDDLFFVVVAPGYSEDCGGCVVLHRLCDQLNVAFADVRDTPLCYMMDWSGARASPPLVELPGYRLHPEYKTPMMPTWMDSRDGVVLYPESIFGNP